MTDEELKNWKYHQDDEMNDISEEELKNWTRKKVKSFNEWKPDDLNQPPPLSPLAPIKTFETGAKRSTDADDTRFDLLPPKALELASRTLAQGAAKYGEHNWQKGMPTTDVLNHAIRHVFQWLDGDTSEPHLSHALVNLMFACHFEYNQQKDITE
ncbi:hypothetical protein FACS1894189_3690 [Planctomycetales bacterium]|nr:hypothetical protein FACS1894189_3690 [Planctomycetales bacterium]